MDPISPQRPLGQVIPARPSEQPWLGQVPPPCDEPAPAPKPPTPPPAELPNDNWAPRGHELFDGSGQPIFGG